MNPLLSSLLLGAAAGSASGLASGLLDYAWKEVRDKAMRDRGELMASDRVFGIVNFILPACCALSERSTESP